MLEAVAMSQDASGAKGAPGLSSQNFCLTFLVIYTKNFRFLFIQSCTNDLFHILHLNENILH